MSESNRIAQRIDVLAQWLHDNAPCCFADQRHLDADTPERAYWHYGYLVALRDVQRLQENPDALG